MKLKKRTLLKQHKWIGIAICLFLVVFCITGILLNHRGLVRNVNVSRHWLPARYEYRNWNGGLLRGTARLDSSSVLLYGNGGIWITDNRCSSFRDFNAGLPEGADYRQVRNVIKTAGGYFYAVSPFGLYRLQGSRWQAVDVPTADGEQLADVASHADTLVVLSRDYAYYATAPYNHFTRVSFGVAPDSDSRVTLFRTIWLLHSGALFGTAGRIIMDAIAIALALLCVTGLILWLRRKGKRMAFKLHDRTGTYTIVLTILIVLTGWSLRPPLLALIAKARVPALPGTALYSDNPWQDKLRLLRHDSTSGDWLLSTSEGFFSFSGLANKANWTNKTNQTNWANWANRANQPNQANPIIPRKIAGAPAPNVMGTTVLRDLGNGRWLCGSMSGLQLWNRHSRTVVDAFTGHPVPAASAMPVGKHAVIGYSADFGSPFVVDYNSGARFAPQPEFMRWLPMSLWNVALELHSGRIYAGNLGSFLFIFLIGVFALWCLWTGYKIR